MLRGTFTAGILIVWLALLPGELPAGGSNSLLDISADGTLLACSNRDSGTLTVLSTAPLRKLREIPVGRHPEGVTFLGGSHQLAVAVYGDDVIKFLDADSGDLLGETPVFDEPYGLVSNAQGTRLWATLDFPGQVLAIDFVRRTILKSAGAGKFLRGIALTSRGRLLVSEYFTGIVKELDPDSLETTDEWTGSPQDNLARQIVAHPTRDKAYLPHQRSLTTVAHGSGSIFPYLAVIDTQPADGKRRKRVQMDSFRGTYVVANPWEVALTPDGRQLFIVFSGTDDLFVCSVLDDDYHEVEYAGVLRTGANPRAVKVSPDGQTFYVYSALDFTLSAYATRTLEKRGQAIVARWPGAPEQLLGKKLFYSANPPMSSRRWISCSSCHPDGDPDGRTWQQPEGLRNTQALFGLQETHPIHWSADRDEVQDFEHTIRSPLMQGTGLLRGPVYDALADRNGGRSKELDALAAYTNSHEFSLSPFAKSGLSAAAQRGKEIFYSQQVGCATCHSGPYFTDQKCHDVGTGADDPTEKIGPLFDTPTLLGAYRSAPYLHHGQAATLKEMLTTFNPQNRHGATSGLSTQQLADLIEYLQALPYEQN